MAKSDAFPVDDLTAALEPRRLTGEQLRDAHDRLHLMFRVEAGDRGVAPLTLDQIVETHARVAVAMSSHPSPPDDGLDYASAEHDEVDLAKRLDELVEKGIRPLWGSPAGKKLLANMIVGLIPSHKTYVEPFAGGGAVFWRKEPSEVEVLGDVNAELMRCWKFAATATDAQIDELKKLDWKATRENRKRVQAMTPGSPAERFYKTRFLAWSGFFCRENDTLNPARDGQTATLPERLGGKSRERLKDVELVSGDYATTIDRYDGPDTFFYLDPPYVGTVQRVGDDDGKRAEGGVEKWDHDRFIEVLRKIKGKFLVTYDAPEEKLKDFSGFNVRKVKAPHQTLRDAVQPKTVVLVSNYKQVSKAEELVEVVKLRGLWGSTAGKSGIAGKIVPLIPEHKTYVEPFAGGAAVFFRKGPECSEKEVLGDMNPEVVHAFEYVRDAGPEELKKLARFDWTVSKPNAKRVHELKPSSPAERFYRFAYKRFALFMRNEDRITAIDPAKEGKQATIVERFEAVKERLQGVEARCEDYRKLFARYDGPDTFFYLDPPYPTYRQEVKEESFDEDAFIAALAKLKGKWLLHYEPRALSKFKRDGWHARIIQTTTTPGNSQGGRVAGQLLEVRNYGGAGSKVEKADIEITVPIAKVDEEKRIVTGIVLEPDEIDAQNDTISPEAIEKAAHRFLANYQRSTQLGLMHRVFGAIGVELIESWVAKMDFVLGAEKVKKGSWLISVHVTSDDVWSKIKTREITGFSIGGTATVDG